MTTMDKLRIDDGYVLERTDAEAVNRRAKLTPDRRPILTPS